MMNQLRPNSSHTPCHRSSAHHGSLKTLSTKRFMRAFKASTAATRQLSSPTLPALSLSGGVYPSSPDLHHRSVGLISHQSIQSLSPHLLAKKLSPRHQAKDVPARRPRIIRADKKYEPFDANWRKKRRWLGFIFAMWLVVALGCLLEAIMV